MTAQRKPFTLYSNNPKFTNINMKKTLISLLALGALSACSTITQEEVVVNSTPEGAIILINDEIVGVTPTTITLDKSNSYELTLVKQGYKNEKMTLTSLRSSPLIKFGLLDDAGYYKQLKASSDNQELAPDFLPAYKGTKAFEDMQKNIDKADQLKKDGKISEKEHSYLIKKIVQFYSAK